MLISPFEDRQAGYGIRVTLHVYILEFDEDERFEGSSP